MRVSPGRLLLAAVEEVGDVRVLLRLGGVQLTGAGTGDLVGERVPHLLLVECDGAVEVGARTASSSSGRRRAPATGTRAGGPGRAGS